MKKFNEIEGLSAYLDGQLNETDSQRLKTRLESDVELASVLTDLSFARNILRALPKRKSPKNFTLTRQMVGLKPPLPKTYPFFRVATVFATLLFVLSFSVNALSPYVSFTAPQFAFGMGGGDGVPAAVEESMMFESAPAIEESPADVAPQSTETARVTEETPAPKNGEAEDSSQDSVEEQNQPQVTNEAVFSSNIIWAFLFISIFGVIIMFVIRQNAKRRWQ